MNDRSQEATSSAWSGIVQKLEDWAVGGRVGALLREQLRNQRSEIGSWAERSRSLILSWLERQGGFDAKLAAIHETTERLDRLARIDTQAAESMSSEELRNLIYCSLFRFRPVRRTLLWESFHSRLFPRPFVSTLIEGRESSLFSGEAAWAAAHFQKSGRLYVVVADGLMDLRGSFMNIDYIINQRTNLLFAIRYPSQQGELLSVINVSMPLARIRPAGEELEELSNLADDWISRLQRQEREIEILKEANDLALNLEATQSAAIDVYGAVLQRLVPDAFEPDANSLFPVCGIVQNQLITGQPPKCRPIRAQWAVSPSYLGDHLQAEIEFREHGLNVGSASYEEIAISSSKLFRLCVFRIQGEMRSKYLHDSDDVLAAVDVIEELCLKQFQSWRGPGREHVQLEVQRSLIRDLLTLGVTLGTGEKRLEERNQPLERARQRLQIGISWLGGTAEHLEQVHNSAAALSSIIKNLEGDVQAVAVFKKMPILSLETNAESSYVSLIELCPPGKPEELKWLPLESARRSDPEALAPALAELKDPEQMLALLKSLRSIISFPRDSKVSSANKVAVCKCLNDYEFQVGEHRLFLPADALPSKSEVRLERTSEDKVKIEIRYASGAKIRWRCRVRERSMPLAIAGLTHGDFSEEIEGLDRLFMTRFVAEEYVSLRRDRMLSWQDLEWRDAHVPEGYENRGLFRSFVWELRWLRSSLPPVANGINELAIAPLPSRNTRAGARLTFGDWANGSGTAPLLVLGLLRHDESAKYGGQRLSIRTTSQDLALRESKIPMISEFRLSAQLEIMKRLLRVDLARSESEELRLLDYALAHEIGDLGPVVSRMLEKMESVEEGSLKVNPVSLPEGMRLDTLEGMFQHWIDYITLQKAAFSGGMEWPNLSGENLSGEALLYYLKQHERLAKARARRKLPTGANLPKISIAGCGRPEKVLGANELAVLGILAENILTNAIVAAAKATPHGEVIVRLGEGVNIKGVCITNHCNKESFQKLMTAMFSGDELTRGIGMRLINFLTKRMGWSFQHDSSFNEHGEMVSLWLMPKV